MQRAHTSTLSRMQDKGHGVWWLALTAWCLLAWGTSLSGQQDPAPPAAHDTHDVDALVAQLDAKDFGQRNEATRLLAARGPSVIPALVTALGNQSREVRFRAQGILAQGFLFDDLVPPLLAGVETAYGPTARILLRDRALMQIGETGELESSQRLFEFWGTNIEELRKGIVFNLMAAQGAKGVAEVVAPLVGLRRKSREFEDLLARLDTLGISYDHRQGAGYVVARMLADGLRNDDDAKVRFAKRYAEAFETLWNDMQARGTTRSAVRKEVADRANMSDGATVYVARWIGKSPPPRSVASERLGVENNALVDELFRGLATIDARECYRCVGKIHIVDMFDDVLSDWPAAPREGIVQSLTDGIAATVSSGDKPKALVYLDAFEACRDLSSCGLDHASGPGQALAHRLYLAALAAPNTREYHPVRSTHARLVQLYKLGIADADPDFPHEFFDRYVTGDAKTVGEDERNALAQYVATLELWDQKKIVRSQPGAASCLKRIRDWMLTQPTRVTLGTRELNRLVRSLGGDGPDATLPVDADQRLADWASQQGTEAVSEKGPQER